MSTGKYTVIVGNIGMVSETDDFSIAQHDYEHYVSASKGNVSYDTRAKGEDVTLFEDGEPIAEYSATQAISCDECSASMINGVFCHEHGCPNRNARYKNGEWVQYFQCRECGDDVRKGEFCNCTTDDEFEWI